jgi:dTDP-4-dehydrorhamnose reductase
MDLKNKKILITGSNGQLGSTITRIFQLHQIQVLPTDRTSLDITNEKQVIEVVENYQPNLIIHCAAYTSVDKAEDDKENCYKINVIGTRNLALISKKHNIEFIYFSTDYVFDGTKLEPYTVTDIPNPINYYGLTKYLGEEIVKTILSQYYIFRISWVFGPNGKNFVNTILRLAKEKKIISIVNDQIGSPTYTIDVANFLLSSKFLSYGTYHLTNEGFCSWYDFAKSIIDLKSLDCKVEPISSEFYNARARRLKNSMLVKNINPLLPNYFDSLKKFLLE